jgi:hypothetical protein
MGWSQQPIPAMRSEARFGDRIVPAFCERPKSIGQKSRGGSAGLRRLDRKHMTSNGSPPMP